LLGRGHSAEPQPDRRKLDKCKVIGGELVAARGDPAALFDLIEETFDPVAGWYSGPFDQGVESEVRS